MKKQFSTAWKASRQIRKQRKYHENAPLHTKHRFMASNLSKELRKKLGTRNVAVRKGDTVKIMRGKFKKKTGKTSMIDVKRERISIEGIQTQKKDGTKINVYFHPSKIQITDLGEDRNLKNKEKKETREEKKPEEENKESKNAQEKK